MVFVNVLLLLVVLEVSLSVVMHPLPTYAIRHNYPGDRVKTAAGPVSAEWVANALGFHDRDHRKGKIKDTTRILMVGDSFLDGPQQTPMPLHVDAALKGEPRNFDVINFSRPGIDTDTYDYLVTYGLKRYHPDIVIVAIYGGNDFRGMEVFQSDKEAAYSFFARYPEPSLLSAVAPRLSIFVHGVLEGQFLHRFQEPPLNRRWGSPQPARPLTDIATVISRYIQADPTEIKLFLEERLTDSEVQELTTFGVRLDLLAYMTGIGMGVDFTERLQIKNKRPEILSIDVASKQVQGVANLLGHMEQESKQSGAEFYVVLIPTSHVDPSSADLLTRLGAFEDPLFYGVRRVQLARLKTRLKSRGTPVIDLSDRLLGVEDTYLKFDTHWNDKGAEMSAEIIVEALLEKAPQED